MELIDAERILCTVDFLRQWQIAIIVSIAKSLNQLWIKI